MKQGYITYYEGLDESGQTIFNGNHTCEVEYTDHVHCDELFDSAIDYMTSFAKSKNPKVVRVVIKNLFKL